MKNQTEKQEALAELKKAIQGAKKNPRTKKPQLYTVLRHVSGSGMSRSISLCYVNKQGVICELDYWLCKALGYTFDKNNGGVKVSGCGMDMGYHLVYNVGAAVYPKGTKKPRGTRNGEPDTSGGYSLNHSWL